jgi:hypothetical protein
MPPWPLPPQAHPDDQPLCHSDAHPTAYTAKPGGHPRNVGPCSAETHFSCLHSPFTSLPRSYLDTVICDPDGSRVAERQARQVVGLASLVMTEGAGLTSA